VEFGLIALLFVGLLFAMIDFGLLLNTWVTVSTGTREIARSASVGKPAAFLTSQAKALAVPSVDPQYGGGWCCGSGNALYLTVEYFTCMPGPGCSALLPGSVSDVYYGGACSGSGCLEPKSDDMIRVTLIAQGAQVITPLLRSSFFGLPPVFNCPGTTPCYVPIRSVAIMRFEGAEF